MGVALTTGIERGELRTGLSWLVRAMREASEDRREEESGMTRTSLRSSTAAHVFGVS